MTISIQTLALILLLGRAISVTFITLVLRKQWRLLKLPVDKEVRTFRKVLFAISIIILVMNFVPIVIDTLTLFVDTGRPASVKTISVAYALSNSFTCALLSMFVWILYKIAEDERIAVRAQDAVLKLWPFKRK